MNFDTKKKVTCQILFLCCYYNLDLSNIKGLWKDEGVVVGMAIESKSIGSKSS